MGSLASFAIVKFISLFVGVRVTKEEESVGLDWSLHRESILGAAHDVQVVLDSTFEVGRVMLRAVAPLLWRDSVPCLDACPFLIPLPAENSGHGRSRSC